MISQFEMIRYRRKTFWIAIVGFGFAVPLLFSLLPLLVNVSDADIGGDASINGFRWYGVVSIIKTFGGLIGLIVGASMGSIDHQNGMSRYIALTGTSRPAHALSRLAGAVATWAILVVVTSLVGLALMLAINGWSPDISHPLRDWLVQMLPGMVSVIIGFGVARAIGSTGIAIAATLGISFVERVVTVIPKVGEKWAEVSLSVAQSEIGLRAASSDFGLDPEGVDYSQALGQSILVICAWTMVPVVAGILIDMRRDL
jgi:ABC-type transport system involved in multi-copper enzyme maturation permease subunit